MLKVDHWLTSTEKFSVTLVNPIHINSHDKRTMNTYFIIFDVYIFKLIYLNLKEEK